MGGQMPTKDHLIHFCRNKPPRRGQRAYGLAPPWGKPLHWPPCVAFLIQPTRWRCTHATSARNQQLVLDCPRRDPFGQGVGKRTYDTPTRGGLPSTVALDPPRDLREISRAINGDRFENRGGIRFQF